MKNICEWENCSEEGKFKAPIEKDNSKKFRLLCLSHIKQFNKSWNYFANMSQTEIEYFLKSDTVWHKPTKKFGSADSFFKILWNNVLDEKLDIFSSANFKSYINTKKLNQLEREAFSILNLNENSNWDQVHKQFKVLVKKYHPDKNSGNTEYENKLKSITLAYSHLKKLYGKK